MDRLWIQAFEAKYFYGNDLLIATSFKCGRLAWNGIIEEVSNLKLGGCHLMGSRDIAIIDVPWLPIVKNF